VEKRGVVTEQTPDIERKLQQGVKAADAKTKIERLDDDFTKQAADKAAGTLKPKPR
jgi:hypothetical protein